MCVCTYIVHTYIYTISYNIYTYTVYNIYIDTCVYKHTHIYDIYIDTVCVYKHTWIYDTHICSVCI